MLNKTQTKYTKAFLASAEQILDAELGIHFTKCPPSLKNTTKPNYPCCVVIGFFIENTLEGQVVYAMSNQFANYITRAMLPDTESLEQNRLQNSCIGELGNMILGRATKGIASNGQIVKFTPPTVFHSQKSTMKMSIDFVALPTVVLILDSKYGALEINIGFKEGNT